VGTATYSGFTAETPVFAYATGTYDDYLPLAIQATSTGNTTYWLCYSTGSGATTCGSSANSCSAGTPIPGSSLSGPNCATPTNPTTALTGLCGIPNTLPDPTNTTNNQSVVDLSGLKINAVSCAMPGSTPIQSGQASATYTLGVNSVAFTPSTGGGQSGRLSSVTVGLTPSTSPPAGNATTPVSATTNQAVLCYSTTTGTAPSSCPTAGTTANGWTCDAATTNNGIGTPPTQYQIASDLFTNTTFYAFGCKPGMAFSAVNTISYSFTAWNHSVTFAGVPGDFSLPGEQIAASNGATAYVSWDSTYLYIGFDKGAGNVSGNNQYVHFYIAGTSGGTSTADTATSGVPDTSLPPANSQFHVFLGTNGSGVVTAQGADVFGTSGWTAVSGVLVNVVHNTSSTFYEFQVALGPLGLSDLHLSGEGWDTVNNAFGTWPGAALTNYQDELLSSAANPNDPANKH
jgi:hypothetical protein